MRFEETNPNREGINKCDHGYCKTLRGPVVRGAIILLHVPVLQTRVAGNDGQKIYIELDSRFSPVNAESVSDPPKEENGVLLRGDQWRLGKKEKPRKLCLPSLMQLCKVLQSCALKQDIDD